ncbi:MAG: class I SAM-dependent methyltransferase [Hydrococcus sp. C42_A2020_068]|uniref:class I SAM-dependent methyltransferase n=1 Tax=Pleurocapsa sp. PCC 7327 TaxID=118163 RepID=UPI00029FE4CC|nr:class I SAM-dependent methyltransferase [Pleurocapsa sp. PCC 7327]AFY79489.1 methyltransferase family protein [Pleurocapsa sp. PCC 7327]MBF2021062.1 class I SAM-dependent methyltransferase [Hydrococcus sp. C42_A2020_068]
MNQKLDYSRYYLKWHSDTPQHTQSMKSFYQSMFSRFLPADRNLSILDIGCGMGFALLALQDMGYLDVKGIEIDDAQVKSCLEKGIKVIKVANSIEYLAKKNNSYELILCLDVIEHIPHEKQLEFVKAIQTSLKPGGKLICTVPNANSGLASRWRYNDWTHHISFTEHSLDFLLFNAGFEKIEIYETEFFKNPGIKGLIKVKPFLHWLLFLLVRSLRRLEMIAELGWEQGKNIPLSLNLLATAEKQKTL